MTRQEMIEYCETMKKQAQTERNQYKLAFFIILLARLTHPCVEDAIPYEAINRQHYS